MKYYLTLEACLLTDSTVDCESALNAVDDDTKDSVETERDRWVLVTFTPGPLEDFVWDGVGAIVEFVVRSISR